MHSSRIGTARSSSFPGGSQPGTPQEQTPREQALSPGSRHPPRSRPPPGSSPPPEQTAPLWTEFLTHAYEKITLPQTSFAGGN